MDSKLPLRVKQGTSVHWTTQGFLTKFQHIWHVAKSQSNTLACGVSTRSPCTWRLSTCSICFFRVSFILKYSCSCFSSGGREGGSNDTVDSRRIAGRKPFQGNESWLCSCVCFPEKNEVNITRNCLKSLPCLKLHYVLVFF